MRIQRSLWQRFLCLSFVVNVPKCLLGVFSSYVPGSVFFSLRFFRRKDDVKAERLLFRGYGHTSAALACS